MGHHPPVEDWATDFDHTDGVWAHDPFAIWDELRRTCPVAHSDRFGGVWLPTRHDDVAAIAYDTDNFTSRSIIVTEYRPPDLSPRGGVPPISSDPPFHQGARRVLLPPFAPQAIARLEPSTREYCEELVDGLIAATNGGANNIAVWLTNPNGITFGSGGVFSASSYHPGGVNGVFGDGSVRFVNQNINAGNTAAAPVSAGPSP